MKPLRPWTDLVRLTWLRFLRDTQDVFSPHLPQLLVRINRIERRSQGKR